MNGGIGVDWGGCVNGGIGVDWGGCVNGVIGVDGGLGLLCGKGYMCEWGTGEGVLIVTKPIS